MTGTRVYLANLDPELFPLRAIETLRRRGWHATGNLYELGESVASFHPDVLLYIPTRRPDAISLPPRRVLGNALVVTWVLYPDQLTGWDVRTNSHGSCLMLGAADLFRRAVVNLVNSRFTKQLLEQITSSIRFDVCPLGIDHLGISRALGVRATRERSHSVLWQHRWSADKNLEQAFDVVAALAPRFPTVTFYVGRWEDWQPCYVPRQLVARFTAFARAAEYMRNVVPVRRFDQQVQFWRFLQRVDIAFSTAYHETFGLAMLEQGLAGAACVVPHHAAYPEVHRGSLIVPSDGITEAIGQLIDDPAAWRSWAAASRRNALRFDVQRSASTLASFLDAAVGRA